MSNIKQRFQRKLIQRQKKSSSSQHEMNNLIKTDDIERILTRNDQTTVKIASSQCDSKIDTTIINYSDFTENFNYKMIDEIMAMDKFYTVKLDDWNGNYWFYKSNILFECFGFFCVNCNVL